MNPLNYSKNPIEGKGGILFGHTVVVTLNNHNIKLVSRVMGNLPARFGEHFIIMFLGYHIIARVTELDSQIGSTRNSLPTLCLIARP